MPQTKKAKASNKKAKDQVISKDFKVKLEALLRSEPLDILGTLYDLKLTKSSEDKRLSADVELLGFTDFSTHEIVLRDLRYDRPTYDNQKDLKALILKTLLHEMIHAFLNESGSTQVHGKLDTNEAEEWLCDWGAEIIPKLYEEYLAGKEFIEDLWMMNV